jgi:hypothetical protein
VFRRTPEALAEVVQSVQFKQQLAVFSAALAAGQLNLAHFGINVEVLQPARLA